MLHSVLAGLIRTSLNVHPDNSRYFCSKRFKFGAATLHRATLNRTTVKRRQFIARHLTGATINRSDS